MLAGVDELDRLPALPWLRLCVPVWTILLYFRADSTIRRPSMTLWLHRLLDVDVLARLDRPDRGQRMPVVGVAMLTAWISGPFSSILRRSVKVCGAERRPLSSIVFTNLPACASSGSQTATTLTWSERPIHSLRWFPPRPPQPMMATLTFSPGLSPSILVFFGSFLAGGVVGFFPPVAAPVPPGRGWWGRPACPGRTGWRRRQGGERGGRLNEGTSRGGRGHGQAPPGGRGDANERSFDGRTPLVHAGSSFDQRGRRIKFRKRSRPPFGGR